MCDRVTLSPMNLYTCLAPGSFSPSSLHKLVVGFCQEVILSRNMLLCECYFVDKVCTSDHSYSATLSLSHFAMMCSCEL